MTEINGGEIIAKMLKLEGVEVVFGIVDGTYLGFIANLRKYKIQIISPRHETSALHMAAAYARLTGKLGVCMASNGPGVANALPGIAVENAEGNRVLLITSARRTGVMYPDRGGTYQCFDQTGVIKQMSKYSEHTPSFERVGEIMRHALRACFEGRPGVVHVDVPEDIMNTKVKAAVTFLEPSRYRRIEPVVPSGTDVEKAASMLIRAKFPLIHAGSGVLHAGASEILKETAEVLDAAVSMSWAARGVLREDFRVFPMIDLDTNNRLRNEADVVLALGSRIGETDWWGKAPYWKNPASQKLIQVDIDNRILGANKPVDLAVHGDVKVFLEMLLERLKSARIPSRRSAIEKFDRERKKQRSKLQDALKDQSSPMHPAHLGSLAREIFPEDTICVMDGGNTAVWANFYFEARMPNTVLSTFKMGMLGAGVAQALGAARARPDSQVLCLIGDGAMGFHPQEVETAIRNKLKVVYVVACDRQWGMVKMNQQFALKPLKTIIKKSLSSEETINTDLGEIRFDLLAESMGATGFRVGNPVEYREALQKALKAKGCVVIHADVNPVRHMWAPGLLQFKDMHKEPAGK